VILTPPVTQNVARLALKHLLPVLGPKLLTFLGFDMNLNLSALF
jgi:hypothetical protein